ncbi:MAG: proton-conducting transporter membrane subunit [Bacteroidetes bacterium]|nr:proton-conducting transporter membrane subunit [Bacteroidota bacterium]
MIGLEYIIYATIGICLSFSIILLYTPLKFKANLAVYAVLVNALLTSWVSFPALYGNIVEYAINAGSILGNIAVRIDGLSAWFILIINFTSVTGIIYGSGYLKAYNSTSSKINLHLILYNIFHLSMIWVCMLQHGLAFLIAWEIMSLSSMLLVIFDHHNPKTIKAGINYLVQMHISVVFLSIGFIWVYFQTDSFSFDAFHTFFAGNSNIWLFLIFFCGFGFKAGFIPFHSWLPHAHPAAPSHISGVMSGVIVKMGIYGIFRIITYLKTDFLLLGEIIVTVSVITGLYGILNAAVHRDFKRMLAFCTIENIGIIGIGIGIGMMGIGNGSAMLFYLGFGGALLHVLNHSLFKSLLFYAAGSVYQQTHTRNMEKLGGLIKHMPKTAVIFLIGAIAIGGIPPFNGFVSEFIIYSGLLEGMKSSSLSQLSLLILSFAGLSIIGGISILAFTKSFGTIFLGHEREKPDHQPKEVSMRMLFPQYIIIVVMLIVAFFPQIFLFTISNILRQMIIPPFRLESSVFNIYSSIITNISIYSVLFIGIIVISWKIRAYIVRRNSDSIQATWGCGYNGIAQKAQYTGKSFSKPLSKILNFLLIEQKQYTELQEGEIFPVKRKYASTYFDFFEHLFIKPFIRRLLYAFNYFKFIQNGRIQSYVIYGIVFIIAIFVLTVLNIIQ